MDHPVDRKLQLHFAKGVTHEMILYVKWEPLWIPLRFRIYANDNLNPVQVVEPTETVSLYRKIVICNEILTFSEQTFMVFRYYYKKNKWQLFLF